MTISEVLKPRYRDTRYCDIIVSDIDINIGYHPILYPILTLISVNAVADIGHPDIGPDINTDIGYVVYDIGDRMTQYR